MAATFTERTYPSTIRVELDHAGATLKREVHERVETLKDGVVILSEDRRVDDLDASAFEAAVTEQYAAAVTQIAALDAEKTALQSDKAKLESDKTKLEADKASLQTQLDAEKAKP